MRNLNEVQLLGHVGQEPEVRHFADGAPVANLSLATNEHYTDKASGERKTLTEWHRIVAKGKLAEIADAFVGKGARLLVKGKLKTREWTDDHGVKR